MDLTWRGGEQVGSAHDIRYALVRLVHRDGKLIGMDAVGASHDEVAHFVRQIVALVALQPVVEDDGRVVHAHAYRPTAATGRQTVATGPRIDRGAVRSQCRIGDFLPRAGARKGRALRGTLLQGGRIGVGPPAL